MELSIITNDNGLPPYWMEAVTRKWNTSCLEGTDQLSCYKKFYAYYQPWLFAHWYLDEITRYDLYDYRDGIFMEMAYEVTHNEELGGEIYNRPSGWATLFSWENPQTIRKVYNLDNRTCSFRYAYSCISFGGVDYQGYPNNLAMLVSMEQQTNISGGGSIVGLP